MVVVCGRENVLKLACKLNGLPPREESVYLVLNCSGWKGWLGSSAVQLELKRAVHEDDGFLVLGAAASRFRTVNENIALIFG